MEYVRELVDRNMVLVHQLGFSGNIKYCKVHDLLRDLCLREAHKEGFYHVVMQNRPRNIVASRETSIQRRVVVLEGETDVVALQSMPFVRSWLCDSNDVTPLCDFKLLRVMRCSEYEFTYSLEDVFKLVNSRYLTLGARWSCEIPHSIYLLWNLHTLDVVFAETSASLDIWSMPQLRYVGFVVGLHLPDPHDDGFVLKNLQKLSKIINFKCYEVVKRIPKIKKLRVSYDNEFEQSHLHNLHLLHQLESLYCRLGSRSDDLTNVTLPHSLKKLTFEAKRDHFLDDVMDVIRRLPNLQKLRLVDGSFRGRKWETVEGQFQSLKFMQIQECRGLENWTTESAHFPNLEHLGLCKLEELEEIPSEIGEITTLKSMLLEMCCSSVIISAKKIVDDQEELYGEVGIQVRVLIMDTRERYREDLRELSSPYFKFI